jgi:hypothetical protein
MEFKRNGISVTVSEQVIARLIVERLLAEDRVADPIPSSIPRIGTDDSLLGGVVAGVMRGRPGTFDGGDYLLIAGPEHDGAIAWQPATEWAEKLHLHGHTDWSLPYRKEQALLFANVPELFKSEYYWSCEQHADFAGYAWSQFFDDGQGYWRKGFSSRVRAVRRVPIR